MSGLACVDFLAVASGSNYGPDCRVAPDKTAAIGSSAQSSNDDCAD